MFEQAHKTQGFNNTFRGPIFGPIWRAIAMHWRTTQKFAGLCCLDCDVFGCNEFLGCLDFVCSDGICLDFGCTELFWFNCIDVFWLQ